MDSRVQPRIGLMPVGHHYYWDQFPDLKARSEHMLTRLVEILDLWGKVVTPELVDTEEKSYRAGELFAREKVDILLVFPLGYTPSMNLIPAVSQIQAPVRLLNAHVDRSYDYASANTTDYLFHEGVCCIPEFSGALVNLGRRFKVRTGCFDDPRWLGELQADVLGAASARAFKELRVGLIGQVYTHMSDMPVDEHRLIRLTGRMLERVEVEEIEIAFERVTEAQLEDMVAQFRSMYAVDRSVTNEHLRFSAQVAVAFDQVIRQHDISPFGYYWWGQREQTTQLRSQSALAVSRLAALGRPGVTEGDVKSAMAVKIFDLLGAGGMFVEFFSMDFEENFFLMGHDGPSNINMAKDKPRLMHLDVHHGKSGHGLGIDFEMRQGPATLLNLTQFHAGDTFKLIYSVGEVIPGPLLAIGNPNCRVRVAKPIHQFMEEWCQQGPTHHIALGAGDQSLAIEAFAEAMIFEIARV